MPQGMFLRSAWRASSISDPGARLTLDAYELEQDAALERPLPISDFLSYARWFQAHAVPEVDTRHVAVVERNGDGFTLELDDGGQLRARRVVVATGLRRFARRPEAFAGLAPELAPHSMDIREPGRLRGRTLAVIGSGQSAVETAALAREAGAEVELIARAPAIRWLTRSARLHARGELVELILYAPTDVGPPGLSWIVALPDTFRRLPKRTQEKVAERSIRPAAAGWLAHRVDGVRFTLGRHVTQAQQDNGAVRLTLDDGSIREIDRLVLATGYAVDAGAEPALGASVRERLDLRDGYPLLRPGLESSVPGLHFAGAYAAIAFGPVMRFVSGTTYAARALSARIAQMG